MNRKAAMAAIAVSLCVSACAVKTDGRCELDADCAVGAQCIDHLCNGGAVPVASFSGPDEVDLGALVSLDGTASARDDGSKDGLVFEWKLLTPPGAEFEGATDGTSVNLRASVPHGTYKVQLVTRDRGTPSVATVREFKVRNSKPVASLSVEPTVWARNTQVTFDASDSTDADGDSLTYEWTLIKDPANVLGTIVAGDNGTATLVTADVAAKYSIKVVVRDEHGGSDDETLEQTLGNAPPTLNPGVAATVAHACTAITCSATFTLTGTVTDVDGTINADSVAWTLKSAPQAASSQVVFQPVVQAGQSFSAETKISNELPAPIVGDYVFELKAKDNDGDESKATVTITVGNKAPTITFVEEAPHAVNHTFADGRFVATVLPKVVVADADGDQLSIEFLDVVTTLPGATVTRAQGATPDSASYEIAVDAANPASLLDGTTPLYEITAKVTDNNGAISEATLPVVILNREPVITGYFGGATQTTVGHTWAAGKYSQDFPIAGLSVVDPDNDPLDIAWTRTGGPNDTQLVPGGGTATVPAKLTLSSADKALVNVEVTATATISDAFGATVSGAKKLKMGNQLPTLTGLPSGTNGLGHSYGLPTGVVGTTKGYWNSWNMTLALVDPDGDPGVAITSWEASTGGVANAAIQKLTVGSGLPTGITLFSTQAGIVESDITLKANLTDGIGTAAASSVVKMLNRAPTVTAVTITGLSNTRGSTANGDLAVYSCSSSKSVCKNVTACFQFCLADSPEAVTVWANRAGIRPTIGATLNDPDGDPITVLHSVDTRCIFGTGCPHNTFVNTSGNAVGSLTADCNAATGTCNTAVASVGVRACVANAVQAASVVETVTLQTNGVDPFVNGNVKVTKLKIASGNPPTGFCDLIADPGDPQG